MLENRTKKAAINPIQQHFPSPTTFVFQRPKQKFIASRKATFFLSLRWIYTLFFIARPTQKQKFQGPTLLRSSFSPCKITISHMRRRGKLGWEIWPRCPQRKSPKLDLLLPLFPTKEGRKKRKGPSLSLQLPLNSFSILLWEIGERKRGREKDGVGVSPKKSPGHEKKIISRLLFYFTSVTAYR